MRSASCNVKKSYDFTCVHTMQHSFIQMKTENSLFTRNSHRIDNIKTKHWTNKLHTFTQSTHTEPTVFFCIVVETIRKQKLDGSQHFTRKYYCPVYTIKNESTKTTKMSMLPKKKHDYDEQHNKATAKEICTTTNTLNWFF